MRRAADTKKMKRVADAVNSGKDVRDGVKSAIKNAYKYGKGKDEELRKNIGKYQNGSNKGLKDIGESFSVAFYSAVS